MTRRRWILAGGWGALAALATSVALTTQAQEAAPPRSAPVPPPANVTTVNQVPGQVANPNVPAAVSPTGIPSTGTMPKYYQGKVSPAPAGLFPPRGTPQPATGRPLPFGQTPPAFQPVGATKPPVTVPTNPVPGLTGIPGQNVQQSGGFPKLAQPVVAGPTGVRPVSASEPSSAPPFFQPKPSAAATAASSPLPEPKPLPGAVNPPEGVSAPSLPAMPAPAPSPMQPANLTSPPASVPSVPSGPVVVTPPSPPPASLTPPTITVEGQSLPPTSRTSSMPQVSSGEPAKLPSFGYASTPLPARSQPSLSVEALIPEQVGLGQPLQYELLVRNTGNTPVERVRLEEELPPRCQFVSTEPPAEPSGEGRTERLTWSLGTVEPGMERRIKITVKPQEEGEIRSRAVVTFATVVETRTLVTRPKIALVMQAPESARVGERVPIQVRLMNEGTGTAGKVYLRAEFTDGLRHAQGAVIEAELTGLPAGQSKMLSLDALASKAGQQLCKLTAIADGVQTELAKATLNIVEPLLTLKQTGPAKCLVKSEPTYTIELANPGTAATEPIQLWASLPTGLELVQASDQGMFLEANRAIGWRLAPLPAGGSKTITIKLRATAPTDGVIRTLAQAASMASEIQPVEARSSTTTSAAPPMLEARAETALRAEGVPALRFEVFDLEDPVLVGKEATYEIRVINQGTGACSQVQIVAEVSEGTTPIGASGPSGHRVEGRQMIFEPIGQFPVKGEAVYRVRVRGDQPGDLRFRVRLNCKEISTPTIKEEMTRFYKE